MRRAHDPPGFRGGGLRLCRYPQYEPGDAGSLGRQRQLAARDEIKLTRLSPNLQHHRADRIAAERIGGGPQRIVDADGAHGHQLPRIEAEFGEPAHRQRP